MARVDTSVLKRMVRHKCVTLLIIYIVMLIHWHPYRRTLPFGLFPWTRMDVDQESLGRTQTKMATKVCALTVTVMSRVDYTYGGVYLWGWGLSMPTVQR